MTAGYFDASASVKLLVHEPESEALVEYLDQPIEAKTSTVSLIDVVRALRRYARTADDDPEGVLDAFAVLDVTRSVSREAGMLDPAPSSRSTPFTWPRRCRSRSPELAFITYDARLAGAAVQHGLTVVQPGR